MRGHIYIDCTETDRVGANTGIQRTVRSILAAALTEPDARLVPVRFDGRAFVALDAPSAAALVRPVARDRALHERVRRIAVAAAPAARAEWVARGRDLASRSYWALRRLRAGGGAPVRFRGGDALVLLDATWAPDLRRELARARAEGARVCTVIYDLIKLRRPDLVSPGAGRIYTRWLARVLPLSDVVATISRAVRDDVVAYLRESGRDALVPRVHSFALGSDLSGGEGEVTTAVASAFATEPSRTFLAVGSLEPRKDQATILEAFETLWREGVDARLVLVGRPGWGSDDLVRRLAAHEARGTRLFWFADASDADLLHCYRHARALVNVSLAEGFGLPLVEGLRNGLDVIASDIPAFREVAAGRAVFVPPGDAQQLAQAIVSVLRAPAGVKDDASVAATTWRESARALVALLDQALP
jgi:glycosyltransferase involved in cell wall biosynthesis